MDQGRLLQEIIKARESIKRKHLALKLGKETTENIIKENSKPVISPLEKLVGNFEPKQIKQENAQYHAPAEIVSRQEPIIKKEQNYTSQIDNTEFHTGIEGEDSEYKEADYEENLNQVENNNLNNSLVENNITSPEGMVSSTPSKIIENKNSNVISDNFPSEVQPFINMFKTQGKKKNLDLKLGIRKLRTGYFIGNAPVDLKEAGYIKIGETKYSSTVGLRELLFKKNPIESFITDTDENIYRDIVLNTHAHKMYYKPGESIRHDETGKLQRYAKIPTTGDGYMQTNSFPINYTYWNDPNELIDRLRLLDSAVAAGNLSHLNEIQSILEELREARIIY